MATPAVDDVADAAVVDVAGAAPAEPETLKPPACGRAAAGP